MEQMTELIHETIQHLKTLSGAKKSAFVGLDGFIDKIQHPVQFQREDKNVYFSTLSAFGKKISSAANQSAQIELFTQQVKLGGNAPIMANAMASLHISNICLGTFGQPEIHPVFKAVHEKSQLISVGSAAETNALEFDDGKLILSELSALNTLDWEVVKQKINLQEVRRKVQEADLVALVDWCNLQHATNIWEGILNDLVKTTDRSNFQFFFDLADPSKKGKDDIQAVLSLIESFTAYGHVSLGLNENETHTLFAMLDGKPVNKSLTAKGRHVFNQLKIDRLVVHPIDRCFVFETEKKHELKGKLVSKPKVTTGGGDNFNAGFTFGLVHNCTTEHAMILAMATSGFYVANGKSPDINELIEHLNKWKEEFITS